MLRRNRAWARGLDGFGWQCWAEASFATEAWLLVDGRTVALPRALQTAHQAALYRKPKGRNVQVMM